MIIELPCIHDLRPADCSFCKPKPAPRPAFAQPAELGPWITASYCTDCAGDCGGEICPGEEARSDGAGGWLCWSCGDEA